MAGEAVDALIRARMARTGENYMAAYSAVVADEDWDEIVAAYKRGEPGPVERCGTWSASSRGWPARCWMRGRRR
jgi:hypothetical protein